MSFLSDRLLSSFPGRVCQVTLNICHLFLCVLLKQPDVNTVWWCLTLTSIASVCQVVQLSDHYPVEVVLKSSALFLQATPLLSLISASVIWSFLSALWSSRALNALYTRLSFLFQNQFTFQLCQDHSALSVLLTRVYFIVPALLLLDQSEVTEQRGSSRNRKMCKILKQKFKYETFRVFGADFKIF